MQSSARNLPDFGQQHSTKWDPLTTVVLDRPRPIRSKLFTVLRLHWSNFHQTVLSLVWIRVWLLTIYNPSITLWVLHLHFCLTPAWFVYSSVASAVSCSLLSRPCGTTHVELVWLTGVLVKHKWEDAMTIDRASWGYRRNANISDYLTPSELIAILAETVRCTFHPVFSLC